MATAVVTQSIPVRIWVRLTLLLEWFFGLGCLLACLGLAASIPILQFGSLGYLLEVSGRISRNNRLRDGFFEIRPAARIGSLLLGTWLTVLPARFVGELSYSAQLFDPNSGITAAWQVAATLFAWLTALHIILAWYCGGRLRYFFWPLLIPWFILAWTVRRLISVTARSSLVQPTLVRLFPRLLTDATRIRTWTSWFPPVIAWKELKRGRIYSRARDSVWSFLSELRLPYYFWLGVRGFLGAIIWLFFPLTMIIGTTQLAEGGGDAAQGIAALLGFFGSLCLAAVVIYLPFLQAHFAAENRFAAMFELRQVRQLFRRAPLAFWFALLVTLLFALPLYLLKLEMIPREVAWAPSFVFVAFIFPARIVTGWALGRARSRETPRHFAVRWPARIAGVPLVLIYVLVVYLSQYTSWYGSWSLFEQHAFLLPVPFLNL